MNNCMLKARAICAAALLATAAGLMGQTITNPSFENNSFTVPPGSISANGPITGWSAEDPALAGLNPYNGTNNWANNGSVPNGSNVAYVQLTNVFSTTITGLEPGSNYMLRFRANAANGSRPTLRAALDGTSLIHIGGIVSVGGNNPYHYVALPFTATAVSQTLYITNNPGIAGATNVLLLDDFKINISTSRWSIAVWTNDATADIDSSRTYTHAFAFNNPPVVPVINGVTFTRISGNNPQNLWDLATANLGSSTSDQSNFLRTNGGGSAWLATNFVYNANPAVFTINNLIPGSNYVATVFSVGWDPIASGRAVLFSAGDDKLSVNQDHFGNETGIRISLRYTAGSDGSFTFSNVPYSAAIAGTLHTYGLANYAVVPETVPVIGANPISKVSLAGGSVGFYATAGGARPLSYRWLKDGIEVSGQTGRVLSLNNLTNENLGSYALWVSNSFGMATSATATLTFDTATIANPSFENDTFFIWPGYASVNYPISAWLASTPTRSGVQPLTGGQAPFANNGIIPNGQKVGFLQSTSAFFNIITNLTPGTKYTLNFRANNRSGQKPQLHIGIDSNSVLDTFFGSTVSTNYKRIATDFTPSNSSVILSLTNNTVGDHAVLLDDFSIAPSTTKWSIDVWTNDATAGIIPTRFYTHAYKFGDSTVDSPVGGITFKALPGANPAVPGFFTAAGFPSVFVGPDNNTVTTNAGESAAIARQFIYNGDRQSFTLTNLQPGVEYVATIYTMGFDVRSYGRAATFSVGNDIMTFNQDHFGNDAGVRISYQYIADSSGSITLAYEATDSSSSRSTIHTYAFSNYQLTETKPTIAVQPANSFIILGDTASMFVALGGGAQPTFYQWQNADGSDLLGETNSSLALSNLNSIGTTGYRVVVSNALGAVTSVVAQVEVGIGFRELFNTGLDNNKFVLPDAAIDPHYKVTVSADPAYPGPNAIVMSNNVSPVIPGTYLTNTTLSQWISVSQPGAVAGIYVYRTTFILDTINPAHAQITGRWASDNDGQDILLNGVSLGISNFAARPFGTWSPFVITNGFVGGSNTIDLIISNLPPTGLTGIRAELYGAGQPLPPTLPSFTTQPQSQFAQEGSPATFTSLAVGSGPLSYQWYHDDGSGFLEIAGQTNRILTIGGVSAYESIGDYKVVVSNSVGPVSSSVASLTVNGAPVANEDFIACKQDTAVAVPASALLFNDSDHPLDSDPISLFGVSATSTNGGTVSFAAGTVTYTPTAAFVGQDLFSYVIADSRGGKGTNVVHVNVGATNFLSISIPATRLPDGHFSVTYSGVPYYPYSIERSTNVAGPWVFLMTIAADENGIFQVDDENIPAEPIRFYRTTYP